MKSKIIYLIGGVIAGIWLTLTAARLIPFELLDEDDF